MPATTSTATGCPAPCSPAGASAPAATVSNRAVDCNHFRYGQCNTQIAGTTEVVCRLVVCHNPATVEGMNCNGTEMVDNRTCTHENPCLQGLAKQLPGGGGA